MYRGIVRRLRWEADIEILHRKAKIGCVGNVEEVLAFATELPLLIVGDESRLAGAQLDEGSLGVREGKLLVVQRSAKGSGDGEGSGQ